MTPSIDIDTKGVPRRASKNQNHEFAEDSFKHDDSSSMIPNDPKDSKDQQGKTNERKRNGHSKENVSNQKGKNSSGVKVEVNAYQAKHRDVDKNQNQHEFANISRKDSSKHSHVDLLSMIPNDPNDPKGLKGKTNERYMNGHSKENVSNQRGKNSSGMKVEVNGYHAKYRDVDLEEVKL